MLNRQLIMARKTNQPKGFWHELKRRKVFNVISVYAGTAFIILQVVTLVKDPLQLPAWTAALTIVLLCIGFIIAGIVAWIYEITPSGMKVTQPEKTRRHSDPSSATHSAFTLTSTEISKGWKIATYASLIVIIALAGWHFYPKVFPHDPIKRLQSAGGRLSVAVMPFKNLTNDTTKNFWQEMIQDNLIISLSNNPEELTVRQTGTVSALLQNNNLVNYSLITPSVGSDISKKLDAKVFILGSINQTGEKIRLNAKLIDSETENIFKSFQIDGKKETILTLTDSLSAMIRNFLILSRLEKELTPDFKAWTSTDSPEAYRYFVLGTRAAGKFDWTKACDHLLQAVSIDSNYLAAIINLSFYYSFLENYEEGKKYCHLASTKKKQATLYQKILFDYLYAHFYETPREEIKCILQLLEIDDQAPFLWSDLGYKYEKLYQYDKAIAANLKSIEIYEKWGSRPFWSFFYADLAFAYHKTGKYALEKEIYIKAEKYFSDDFYLLRQQAILALMMKDSTNANQYIKRFVTVQKNNSVAEVAIYTEMAKIYSEAGDNINAEKYYRQAADMGKHNPEYLNNLAFLLIDKELNVAEGMNIVNMTLETDQENYDLLHTKGLGLYKQGKYKEAQDILQKSWRIRREKAVYNHEAFLHLEATQNAVAEMK